MDPLVTSALISSGGSLLGGLLQKKSDKALTSQNYWNRLTFDEGKRQFDAMLDRADRQAQYRVRDAKAAGLHPLYALGASANVSPTVGGLQGIAPSSSGGAAGDVVRGIADAGASFFANKAAREDAELARNLQLQRLQADRDRGTSEAARNYSEAHYFDTRSKMMELGVNSSRSAGDGTGAPVARGHSASAEDKPTKGGSARLPLAGDFRQSPTSDAQVVEDKYGDAVSWAYGAGRAIYDIGQAAERKWGLGEKFSRWLVDQVEKRRRSPVDTGVAP